MKTKRRYDEVMPVAEKVLNSLSRSCTRIELAGSLRRHSPMVGDIEIVCISDHIQAGLFDNPGTGATVLDEYLSKLLIENKIRHPARRCWGPKLKRFIFEMSDGPHQVDVFIQTPETWGCNFMIRTGSEEFTKAMVTPKSKGGLMPNNMSFSGARLYRDGEVLSTPEEADVFRELSVPYVEPHLRIKELEL